MVWAVSLSTTDLSTRNLTADYIVGIRSLSEISNRDGPTQAIALSET